MQTVASKPVRRVDIVLGKWLAFAGLTAGYLVLMAGGVLLISRVIAHLTLPGIQRGLPLMLLESWVLVSLTLAGGARLSTVTTGVVAFGFYGVAFIGSWVEQIGAHANNLAARNVGTIASLIMPTEAMWQLAAHHMQPRDHARPGDDAVFAGIGSERGDGRLGRCPRAADADAGRALVRQAAALGAARRAAGDQRSGPRPRSHCVRTMRLDQEWPAASKRMT